MAERGFSSFGFSSLIVSPFSSSFTSFFGSSFFTSFFGSSFFTSTHHSLPLIPTLLLHNLRRGWLWSRITIHHAHSLNVHRHRLIAIRLTNQLLSLLAEPGNGRGNLDALSDAVHLLLDVIQLIVLVQNLEAILVEILAGLDEILTVNAFSKEHFFQRDFIAAEIRIHSMGQLTEKRALEMLVELLLRSGQIALSEVDDDDGQVALETSANTTRLARTCCAPAEDA